MHKLSFIIVSLLFLALFQAIDSNAKTIRINPSIPIEEQLLYAGAKYVVKNSIDLKGTTIKLPSQSKLVIKRGTLSNGVVIGENSRITLNKNYLEKDYYVVAGGRTKDKPFTPKDGCLRNGDVILHEME